MEGRDEIEVGLLLLLLLDGVSLLIDGEKGGKTDLGGKGTALRSCAS